MKLAVSGKGGVGKTTVSALISSSLAARDARVIAIDADPDSNLLSSLGHTDSASVRPLVELKELIEERTGVKPGSTGGMFKLNPDVSDLPEKYAVDVEGVKVLVAGAVKKGGSGCYCPENSLLRSLIAHLLMDQETTLVLDMEAGVEHLGRGTIQCVDRLLVVVEPGMRAVETARRVRQLASDIGIRQVSVVANRVASNADREFLTRELSDFEIIAFLPFDERVAEAERNRRSVTEAGEEMKQAIESLIDDLSSN